jgi:hypothetical protein
MNDRPSTPSELRSGRVRRSAVVQLLAPTLGLEKSREVVAAAARQLGYPDPVTFSLEQAESLLQHLTGAEGIVGVVARYAVNRVGTLVLSDDDEPTDTGIILRPPTHEPGTGSYNRLPTVSMSELVELFASSIDSARASELLRQAADQLKIGPGPWPRPQAVTLLEHLCTLEGMPGVVARYVQPRVLQKLSK